MKNLDSILSRPHRRLTLNTNHITYPHYNSMQFTPKGKAASTEHSIWGRNQKLFLFSSIQMSSGRGNGTERWDEDSVNIPIISYLYSLQLCLRDVEQIFRQKIQNKRKTKKHSLRSNHQKYRITLIYTCRIQIVLTIRDISEELQSDWNQLSGWTDKLCFV